MPSLQSKRQAAPLINQESFIREIFEHGGSKGEPHELYPCDVAPEPGELLLMNKTLEARVAKLELKIKNLVDYLEDKLCLTRSRP